MIYSPAWGGKLVEASLSGSLCLLQICTLRINEFSRMNRHIRTTLLAFAALFPCLCHAVDPTSPAYRKGRVAGMAVIGIIILLWFLKRFGQYTWGKALAFAGVAALAYAMWTGAPQGSGKSLSRLDESTVKAFVQSGVRASEQRDARALCAQVTEDAQVKLIEVRLSGSHTQSFAKPDWCDYLRKGYADIPPSAQISTELNIQSVEIAADGQSAEVSMVVIEQVQIAGQSLQMQSSQNGRIALVGGQPRYTALSARVVGGQ